MKAKRQRKRAKEPLRKVCLLQSKSFLQEIKYFLNLSRFSIETTQKQRVFVPHVREELLNKIETLKLANEDDDEDFSFDESDIGSDFGDSDDEE